MKQGGCSCIDSADEVTLGRIFTEFSDEFLDYGFLLKRRGNLTTGKQSMKFKLRIKILQLCNTFQTSLQCLNLLSHNFFIPILIYLLSLFNT
jgi:hypothetical protein